MGWAFRSGRYNVALEIVMQRARAKSGFLYILQDDGLRLAAASSPNEPPIGLETELRSSAKRMRENEVQDADEAFDLETAMAEFAELKSPNREYNIVMLTMRLEDEPVVVGGFILGGDQAELPAAFLEEIANALHESAAVSTAF
jgi:hypothetical protein